MYTQHFGLEKPVFDGGIAQNDDLFLGPRQQHVAANLKIGLTTRDSVVTLSGALGVGKTTIAAHALRITATRLAQTWVGNTPLTPDELLELLLAGFELAPYDMGRVQRLHTWRQFMGEMSVTDTRICILVENALVLGPEGLQALEALTAPDPNDCPGANLVLMGPADLTELLEEPGLAPLKQRIRSYQRLEPMTQDEVEQYLRHRVGYVGGDYDTIFAPGSAAMVHCFSAGIPRVINNVCETALIAAATGKTTQVGPEIVQRVAESVYGLAPSGQVPVAAAEQPAAGPMPPAEPAAVDVATQAPEAAPAASAEQPATEPAPNDEDANVDQFDAELLEALLAAAPSDAVEHSPEPPVLTETVVVSADAAPQPATAVSGSSGAIEDSLELPVLTDQVDFELPNDSKVAAGNRQPLAGSLPPDAPALPDSELEPDDQFTEDITAAAHLHEINDELAEMLFSADPATSSTGVFEAAAPLDSGDLEQTPGGTAIVRQIDENGLPKSEEDQTEPEPDAARTVVF